MLNAITIGEKITRLRKKNDLSQSQLSEMLLISPQAISKWERGESLPDIILLDRIAQIFFKDLNYFSDWENGNGENNGSGNVAAEDGDANAISPSGAASNDKIKPKSFNMSAWVWVDADFSGLNNTDGKFRAANAKNCIFKNADLSGTPFRSSNIAECDFSGARLSGCKFTTSNVDRDIFSGADLTGTEFAYSNVKLCDFSNAVLNGAIIRYCNFKNILSGVKLAGAEFIGNKFEGGVENSTLDGCSLVNNDFKKTTFNGVTFLNTFVKSKIKKAAFRGCKADGVSYSFLQAAGADMSEIEKI
jgi:uncharacterized protein YjbI with pentapeptide repeats/DNA-binding XRE family transcriptional regulator